MYETVAKSNNAILNLKSISRKTNATFHGENRTGIPIQLKKRLERNTGISLNDVRVNYNSKLPAKLDALAYTSGNQVEIASGQEKHLPHELGHVIQQKLGLVRANAIHSSGVAMNTDQALERQADEIGAGKSVEAVPQMGSNVVQRCPGPGKKEKEKEEDSSKRSHMSPQKKRGESSVFYTPRGRKRSAGSPGLLESPPEPGRLRPRRPNITEEVEPLVIKSPSNNKNKEKAQRQKYIEMRKKQLMSKADRPIISQGPPEEETLKSNPRRMKKKVMKRTSPKMQHDNPFMVDNTLMDKTLKKQSAENDELKKRLMPRKFYFAELPDNEESGKKYIVRPGTPPKKVEKPSPTEKNSTTLSIMNQSPIVPSPPEEKPIARRQFSSKKISARMPSPKYEEDILYPVVLPVRKKLDEAEKKPIGAYKKRQPQHGSRKISNMPYQIPSSLRRRQPEQLEEEEDI